MKKFLSLVLALVMTMSLVTISAGAEDFTDDASINYEEAVDVMSAVGVVGGYADGSFNPTAGLSRGAAAKIICNMILGPTTAAALSADTAPYKDVATDNTYAGYIAYCAQQGIISGYTDGTFRPYAPLTGYAFQKMLLGALGYDADVEGYNQPNWSIAVAKQALGIGLNAGLKTDFNGAKAVTREEACLFAFNTLKATMVEYDTVINIGDVTIAGSQAKNVAQTGYKNTMGGANLQFAEKYFTKLSLDTDVVDCFGRPCNEWTNDKKVVGTYVDYTLLVAEYTTGVAGKDVYADLGKNVVEEYTFDVLVDGEDDAQDLLVKQIVKNNKEDVPYSGNGARIQVYVDKDNEEVTIAVINTYLAFAAGDYNAKKDTLKLDIYFSGSDTSDDVKGEDFAIAVDAVEGDAFLVTYDKAEDEVVSIVEAEIIADTAIDGFSKDSSLTVDGEKYSYGEKAFYDTAVLDDYTGITTNGANLKDVTYNVYLDTYGYVIGVDEVTAPTNYLFITGMDADATSNLSTKTYEANAIFMDGTSAVIDVKNDADLRDFLTNYNGDLALINSWFAYTVSSSGVYTLDVVASTINTQNASTSDVAQYKELVADSTIDIKHHALMGAASGTYSSVYGNDATIYLSAEVDELVRGGNATDVIVGVEGVTTGLRNACIELKATKTVNNLNVFTLYKENGYIIASVVVGEDAAATKNLVYVNNTSVDSEKYDSATGLWTWTLEVILDGEAVTLVETNDTGVSELKDMAADVAAAGTSADGIWYQVKYKADDTVHTAVAVDGVNVLAGEYVTAWANVFTTIAAKDTVLFDRSTKSTGELTLIGNTLYDATNSSRGFFVADDVKVVLIQNNDNKTTTTYEEGVSALEDVLAEMNYTGTEPNETYGYWFNVIVEDGAAKVVVIKDTINGDYTLNNGGQGSSAGLVGIGYNAANDYLVASTTQNVTADTTYTVTLSMVNGGTVVELATYDIVVSAGAKLGYKTIGALAQGQQYLLTCGDYSTMITG